MKKPKAVIAAEAAEAIKHAELEAAKETVARLEKEWALALAATRAAQTEADAALPQCRMVRVIRHGRGEQDAGRMVILRRTPSGMLVVRYVGESNSERKFKWAKFADCFRQAKAFERFDDFYELRDVPTEFMPVVGAAA